MSEPWTFQGPAASISGTVTLVEETSFCLSGRTGDIHPGTAHGLFFLDTRFLSRFELRIDERPVEGLAVSSDEPFGATFLVRPTSVENMDPSVVVFRRRKIGRGLVEWLEVRNHGSEPRTVDVSLHVDADFADLFTVKEQRAHDQRWKRVDLGADSLRLCGEGADEATGPSTTLTCHPEPHVIHADALEWRVEVPAAGRFEVCVEVTGGMADDEIEPRFRCGGDGTQEPERRLAAWRADIPTVDTADSRLTTALRRTSQDLGALRLVDPDHPEDVIVAAGAPWFMTLFGRDALITAYMALMVDPRIALGVLRTLARLQGTSVDPDTDEQPGRILHEIRFHQRPSWKFADGTVYFGSADSSPLFVVLLGELRRWGLADAVVDELLPAADRALEWVTDWGDRDGDGYVEYQRGSDHGLANQGWKDSWDAVRFADGRFAEGPIALCEVQGYVYAAYLARAYFAEEEGDLGAMRGWLDRAEALRDRFHRDFWLPDLGYIAMGLDGEKRPIDSLTSNMGHCLWSGIVHPEIATSVARHLLSPSLFSGWGIRTMASSMAAYNPVSYHLGSIWPHDNALCVAGLTRYGFVDGAHTVIDAMLDVAAAFDGRLPELIAGVDRSELTVPAVYPTSCLPQAWAAASPLLFLRNLLRVDPWIRRRKLWISPALPSWVDHVALDRVPLDGSRISITARDGVAEVSGLNPDIELHTEPRHPVTAAL